METVRTDIKEIHCIVSGRVQAVTYREFTKRKARPLGITGEVENMKDFTVRVVAQGREDDLKKFIEHLHKGPFGASISRVDVSYCEPTIRYRDFTIIY